MKIKAKELGEKIYEIMYQTFSKNECKTLAFLLINHDTFKTSRELEYDTELRQPEASVSLSVFIHKAEWVEVKHVKKQGGKGRPNIYFKLKVKPEYILDNLKNSLYLVISDSEKAIKKLEEIKEEL